MYSSDNRHLAEMVERAPGGASARRDRVLAHPDLVKRLTEPPLNITDPYRWTGWIPPRALPEEACGAACGTEHRACPYTQHRSMLNDSPFRRQLVEIAAEALRREQQPALDEVTE